MVCIDVINPYVLIASLAGDGRIRVGNLQRSKSIETMSLILEEPLAYTCC